MISAIDDKTRRKAAQEIFRATKDRVDKQAGRDLLGPRLYRALLAEAFLAELASMVRFAQGESLAFMIEEHRSWLNRVAPI